MTTNEVKPQVRKIQKSPTGYYVNLPKKLLKSLNIEGNELVKVIRDNEPDQLIVKIIRV